MTRSLLLLVVLALVSQSYADLPPYYSSIDPVATGETLRAQLTALINPHTVITYNDLWAAFEQISLVETNITGDGYCPAGQLNDIYSAKCWGYPAGQCGNYQKEGDCYNREHSFPKSWWGGTTIAAYSDLFHLYPSDGYDNNIRTNNPLGRVDPTQVQYRTSSGCLSGPCLDLPGTTCWEPAGHWKGVLARTYFYMSVAYHNTFTCCDEPGTNGAIIKPWLLKTLINWHNAYPVDQYELTRNEYIFTNIQHNRNPFIDNPAWVSAIWL